MSFKELVQSVENSDEFKDFRLKHSNAVLCAGFFILDLKGAESKNTVDYLDKDKVYIFSDKEGTISIEEDELISAPNNQLKKIHNRVNNDLDTVTQIAQETAEENRIMDDFNKIIAVVQLYSGDETGNHEKLIWNLTCMLDNLIIVHVLIDSEDGKVLKFQKKSVMDFVKKS